MKKAVKENQYTKETKIYRIKKYSDFQTTVAENPGEEKFQMIIKREKLDIISREGLNSGEGGYVISQWTISERVGEKNARI